MPICPKCKEIITYLNWSEPKNCFGTYDLESGYEEDGNVDISQPNITYSCPECSEEFDFDEYEAKEFLKNKDELQEIVAEKLNKIKENEKC